MSLRRFLTYVQFSRECPGDVRRSRWAGMLKWFDSREELKEPHIY